MPASPRQRQVVAIALNDVRLDARAAGLGSSGGAIDMMTFGTPA
jgi:hypothetical protein